MDAANSYLASFAGSTPPSPSPLVRISLKAGIYHLTNGPLIINGQTDSTNQNSVGYPYGQFDMEGAGAGTTTIDGSGNTGQNVGPVLIWDTGDELGPSVVDVLRGGATWH